LGPAFGAGPFLRCPPPKRRIAPYEVPAERGGLDRSVAIIVRSERMIIRFLKRPVFPRIISGFCRHLATVFACSTNDFNCAWKKSI